MKTAISESMGFRWQQGDKKGLIEGFELKFKGAAVVFQAGRRGEDMPGRRNHVERHCSSSAVLEHKAHMWREIKLNRLAEPCMPPKAFYFSPVGVVGAMEEF